MGVTEHQCIGKYPDSVFLPANLMTILILYRGKCGLAKGITCYMAAMAVGDLMVLFFNVVVSQIVNYHFPDSLLKYTYACRFTVFMQGTSIQLSIWFTISFTFDRFIAICCQELKSKYCTAKTAKVIITTVCVVNVLINVPMPFRYEPYYVLNNVQWGCRTVTQYFTSQAWTAHRWITNLSSALLPIPLLLLLNSLTARHILVASRARKALKSSSNGDTASDPELKNRRTSIILLFTISGSFVVLSAPITLIHICVGVTQTVTFQGSNSLYLAIRTTFLLMCTSSCTNTCIYALAQRRFRVEIKDMAKHLYSVIIQLCK
ncbi:probable G-protein coupled receptor 139 [Carcharodon carcharias]|uniref:probable G-protein coupled receptor 139 n=1 Tax=Carcharodon carcharias TaxID=13397 RepID=UPI001B7E7206|nr:probable G-protein coupled receptor 139 [Carcharodon carcharias]